MNAIWQKLLDSLSPLQVCWLCLFATAAGGMYAVNVFAKNDEVTSIRVELLQQRLLDLRIRQCQAIKDGQPAAFWAGQIQEQATKYYELTNRSPQLPGCGEL